MDLMAGEQPVGRCANVVGDPAAVLKYAGAVVVGTKTAIERAVNAVGHATLTAKETVRNARKLGEGW